MISIIQRFTATITSHVNSSISVLTSLCCWHNRLCRLNVAALLYAHTQGRSGGSQAAGKPAEGVSDLIPQTWINVLIIVCLINDHHLSRSVCACLLVCACLRLRVSQSCLEEVTSSNPVKLNPPFSRRFNHWPRRLDSCAVLTCSTSNQPSTCIFCLVFSWRSLSAWIIMNNVHFYRSVLLHNEDQIFQGPFLWIIEVVAALESEYIHAVF